MTSRIGLVCLLAVLTAPVIARQAGTPTTQTAPPPITTSAISGVVIDGSTGSAVPGAIVTLRTPQANAAWPQSSQLTDDKGRFAFVNLPASPNYTLNASKFGYISGGYGRETDPADPLRLIPLKDNDWASNLRVTIWKPGSISGMVRDENGDPVIGVFVRALVRYRLAGRDELAAGPITLTDDRGAYRIAGLGPGRYIIQVPSVQASLSAGAPPPGGSGFDGVLEMDDTSRLVIGRYPLPPPPSNGRRMAYPIAFHPTSSLLAQATAIDLKYGDDRANIDVSLTPAPAVRVSGIVEAPPDAAPDAVQMLTLRLLPVGLDNLGHGSEAATAMVGPTGQFTFLNVPAGSYVIDAPVKVSEFLAPGRVSSRTSFPGPPGVGGWGMTSEAPDSITGLQFTTTSFRNPVASMSARMPLTVGAGDMTGVVIRLRPHLTMTPRFVFENEPGTGRPTPPPNQWLPLSLDPAGGEAYLGRPRFTTQQNNPTVIMIPGVMPGQYWFRQFGDSRWIIKSVSWKGRDYSTTPIDTTSADDLNDVVITVTNAVPELTGNVRISGDAKPDETLVVAFPVDQTLWRNTGMWPARLKSTTPSATGAYQFASLPAGSYFVAAIDRRLRMTWIDPDVLAQLARNATPVTLTWGGKTSQDLSFTTGRK